MITLRNIMPVRVLVNMCFSLIVIGLHLAREGDFFIFYHNLRKLN